MQNTKVENSHLRIRTPISRRIHTMATAALAAFAVSALSVPAEADDHGGWISLFDGESLDGWKASENPDSFHVEDGIIVVDGPRGHLFYEGDVGNADFIDFEMRMDVKTFPRANSGVFFHTEYQDDGWPRNGYEVQINATHTDRIKTGSIYAVENVMDDAPNEDEEWFNLHFTVIGNRVIVKVDGELVNDFTEPEGTTGPRHLSSGTVALQAHDPQSVIHFRNIELRELSKPAPIKALYVTGGGWHDYEAQEGIVTEGLGHRIRMDWTIENEAGNRGDHWPARFRQENWAEDFDVVVYNFCITGTPGAEHVDGIVDMHVELGVPAVFMHCAIHSFRADTTKWFEFGGVRSHRHEGKRPFEVKVLEDQHPIMIGFPEDGWRTPQGELYEIAEIYESATPLAHAYGQDTERNHTVIWTNEYEGVSVFGTTIGHHNETMAHDVYLDLVSRGLLWSVGKLNENGSPVIGYEGAGVPPFQVDSAFVNLIQPTDSIRALPNGNTPDNEGVERAIDGKSDTKYLHFDGASSGFQVTTAKPGIVRAIRLTSANDAPERDPASYLIEGSNNGNDWKTIARGVIEPFAGRHTVRADGFENAEAYSSYRVLFPTVRGDGSPMQIAKVELMGPPPEGN